MVAKMCASVRSGDGGCAMLKVLKNGVSDEMVAEVFDFRDKNEYLCSPIISKISVFCLTVIAFGRAEREA